MTYHILNGDAIAEKFPSQKIPGQIIVIREAFIEGPLSNQFSADFWEKRLQFVGAAYAATREDYAQQFLSQLQLLDAINDEDEVYLWFEDDLFCLVNLWFVIYYLSPKTKAKLFRVFPEADDEKWMGFAKTKELPLHFQQSVLMNEEDIELSNQFWESYTENDREKLKALSNSDTTCFRFLPQVIQAHLDRDPGNDVEGRPQQTLIDILNSGKTDFYEIYEEFWKKEAIYGFGDMQVYNLLREMEIEFSDDLM